MAVQDRVNLEGIDVKKIDLSALSLVPEEFATKNCILPIKIHEELLYVAVRSNEERELIARLKLVTNMKLKVIEYPEEVIAKVVVLAYEYLNFNKAIEKLKKELVSDVKKEKDKSIPKDDNNAPAVKMLDYLINNAIVVRASDIHLEPEDIFLRVRYRIDGSLIEFLTIPMEIYGVLVTRLKVLCSMDISEKRAPQDGKYQYTCFGKDFDLRVSTIPVVFGEKFVIRILDKGTEWCNLENLYDNHEHSSLIKNILMHSSGIILTTGPTGSGKSTTLYAMLKELNNKNLNITTIEDPVEYSMKGINQINVNVKSGINFAAGLRSILRQDPDVIMIGEIRDEETASIAIRAAITGHLVLSTLHTKDAIGTINRLVEMGIERYLLADALISVIAQRLVRKVCNNCKESYYATEIEKEILEVCGAIMLYRGKGCTDCNYSGYSGRKVVMEILIVNENIRKQILKVEDNLQKEMGRRGSTLTDNCKSMVLKGITTVEEFIKVSNSKLYI